MNRDTAADLIERAIAGRVFPAAVAEVGDARGVIWRQAFGTLWYAPTETSASGVELDAPPTTDDTIFDLASLAKPLSSATLAIGLVGAGAFSLDDPVARHFSEWRGADREGVTVRDLLEHASGLAARLIDRPPATRREFEHDICTSPLEYAPRSKSIYSDLGFILLGFLIANAGDAPLRTQFDALWRTLSPAGGEFLELGPVARGGAGLGDTRAPVFDGTSAPVAPTRPIDGDARKGRILTGEVHDEYAAALGGAAGHSGLFGSAPAVGRFARAMLLGAQGDARTGGVFSPQAVRLATTRTTVPGSSRALGWDTMLPTSSCGTMLSPAAFGHVGFTGTSLWIDPVLDRYFILLTNRAYGDGTLEEMRAVRRAFHDALAASAR